MVVPGERAHRTEQERIAAGIPLSPSVLAELLAVGEELGVSPAGLSREDPAHG
jgi:LDH2 family malate/lactate/ureidoglycolate dehydrogenase